MAMNIAIGIIIAIPSVAMIGTVGFATAEFWASFPDMAKSMVNMFFKD